VLVGSDRRGLLGISLQRETAEILIMQRAKVISVAGDGDWVVTANRDSELLVFKLPGYSRAMFTIPTFTSSISCCTVSSGFHSIVFGTRDASLMFCSLNSGTVKRIVSLGGCRPLRILVSPFWGFVVVHMTKITEGKLEHRGMTYSLDGEMIQVVIVEIALVARSAFRSTDGVNYVVMVDFAGNCFLFEAFFLDIGRPFLKNSSNVVCMRFFPMEATAVLVSEDGTLSFVRVGK
jgi:hypothetical protein